MQAMRTLALSLLLLSCGNGNAGFSEANKEGTATPGSSSVDAGVAPEFGEVRVPDAGRSVVGHLRGKVVAPEGTIPMSGALVYLTGAPPQAIPNGTYCDKCVELTASNAYAFSKPSGDFDLPAYQTGDQFLVVQKGAFRRVRKVSVVAGDQSVPANYTRLPSRTNKSAGDDVPKMAVAWGGSFDKIEDSLVKLGIERDAFDVYGSAIFGQPDGSALIQDAATLSKYHVVFLPCTGWDIGKQECNDRRPQMAGVQGALREFVSRGGKLYATDLSYEYVQQTFPKYLEWRDVRGRTGYGAACTAGEYDAQATLVDPGLSDWLAALGQSQVTLQKNYATIAATSPAIGPDIDGTLTTITPKVWVTGQSSGHGTRPATVSFGHGCGRVMYSNYHTEGSQNGQLLAQEKALLYVLLEVGVCVGPMPPEIPR